MKVINKYRHKGRCGGLQVCDAGGVSASFHYKKDIYIVLLMLSPHVLYNNIQYNLHLQFLKTTQFFKIYASTEMSQMDQTVVFSAVIFIQLTTLWKAKSGYPVPKGV